VPSLSTRWAKTDVALHRLDRAIGLLEQVLPTAPQGIADLFGGDEATRASQDYAKLDHASREVEARLDTMVDRLHAILEE
jgi:hypothetical protein